ncbi:MAG: 2Fe-2S iron-sulfur cluster-binding protein [Myxococcota bacterium]|nr:2Fe-2S iron-sulfur cluster-binding protein [Myxococcota bacterium]
MTPFGIRKKLKALMDGGRSEPPPPVPEVAKFQVQFILPDGSSYETTAKDGDSLVLASGRGPSPIATGCSDGTCATCRVEVKEGDGQLSPPTVHEAETRKANGVDESLRLGCQAAVLGEGVKVKIVNVFGEEPI